MYNRDLMTSREVCEYCEFSPSILNRLEKQGLLLPVKKLPASGKRFYCLSDVDAYMKLSLIHI